MVFQRFSPVMFEPGVSGVAHFAATGLVSRAFAPPPPPPPPPLGPVGLPVGPPAPPAPPPPPPPPPAPPAPLAVDAMPGSMALFMSAIEPVKAAGPSSTRTVNAPVVGAQGPPVL